MEQSTTVMAGIRSEADPVPDVGGVKSRSGIRHRMARRVRVLIALGVLGSTMGVGTVALAATAGAATATVTYPPGMHYSNLTTITNGSVKSCDITGYLPTNMINYSGTTEVATALALTRWNGSSWYTYLTSINTATSWVPSGSQLNSIYWNNRLPGQATWSFGTATSSSYWDVVAFSMWLIGGKWYSSSATDFGVYIC
jgi:hypothetical protein